MNFQGTRSYMNGLISLKQDQIRKLKNMNKNPSFDSTFVSYVLSAIFLDDELKTISIGGRRSNVNDTLRTQLDPNKLSFVRGM